MIEILVKIIIVAVAAIVFVAAFREEWQKLRAREDEYDAFERRRALRQRDYDRHAKATARRELIETWGNITVGRWQP
jgi:hypothetical protein